MLYEIFVGKIFVLKIFRRVDVLRKYFNMKILHHRRTYGERVTAIEKFFERNCIRGYHVYKSMGSDGWRGVGVRKRTQKKTLPIDMLWL